MPEQKNFADGGLQRQFVRTRGRLILIDARRVSSDANTIVTYESAFDLLIDQIESAFLDTHDSQILARRLHSEIDKMKERVKDA